MTQKIVKKREIEEVEYIGHCPDCGIEQISNYEDSADSTCSRCEAQKLKDKYKWLIGAKIIDVKSDRDSLGDINIVIVEIDNKKYSIKGPHFHNFTIEKYDDGNA